MKKIIKENGMITVSYTFPIAIVDEMCYYAYLWYDGDYSKIADDYAVEDYDGSWCRAAIDAMKSYDTGAIHNAIVEAVNTAKTIHAAQVEEWKRLEEENKEITGD